MMCSSQINIISLVYYYYIQIKDSLFYQILCHDARFFKGLGPSWILKFLLHYYEYIRLLQLKYPHNIWTQSFLSSIYFLQAFAFSSKTKQTLYFIKSLNVILCPVRRCHEYLAAAALKVVLDHFSPRESNQGGGKYQLFHHQKCST